MPSQSTFRSCTARPVALEGSQTRRRTACPGVPENRRVVDSGQNRTWRHGCEWNLSLVDLIHLPASKLARGLFVWLALCSLVDLIHLPHKAAVGLVRSLLSQDATGLPSGVFTFFSRVDWEASGDATGLPSGVSRFESCQDARNSETCASTGQAGGIQSDKPNAREKKT